MRPFATAPSALPRRAVLLLAALVALGSAAHAQPTTVLFEDFEDGSVAYTLSTPEFNDGQDDFFLRTDGTDLPSKYQVTGANGTSYFAAQDIDGEGADAMQSLTFSGIDISGLSALSFSALFAEDDASNGEEDWDVPDHVRVFAQIDGEDEVLIFAIEDQGVTSASPRGTNTAPRVDSDLDGVGEGAEITDEFAELSAAFGGTGSTLTLRIEISLDAGDEDIAIDDVTVRGTAAVVAAEACTESSPLSFDFDGQGGVTAADFSSVAGGARGEFAGVRHEGDGDTIGGGAPVDLSSCSFVTLYPYGNAYVLYSAVAGGEVAPGERYVFATQGGDQGLPADVLFNRPGGSGPGAFALITGASAENEPLTTVVDRVVAAVVYGEDGAVFGSVRGGATDAEMAAFRSAFARIAGGATDAEAGGAVDLSVAAWPNPTAGAATVAFGLAAGGAARVAVYDVLGREVAVLADGPLGVGRHEVPIATGALPAGLYVVRVATDAGVQTARLTVAR